MLPLSFTTVFGGAGGVYQTLKDGLYIKGIHVITSAGTAYAVLAEDSIAVASLADVLAKGVVFTTSPAGPSFFDDPVHVKIPRLKIWASAAATVTVVLYLSQKQSKLYQRND